MHFLKLVLSACNDLVVPLFSFHIVRKETGSSLAEAAAN